MSGNLTSVGNAILTADAKRPPPIGAKPLGRDQDRVWIKLGWAELAALDAQQAQGWALAFLDEDAFMAGTVGFSPTQIREVMVKRAGDQFQLFSEFCDALGETAGKLAAWGRDGGGAWERNSAKTFLLHQETYFTGRFIFGTHEDLVQIIQWRACLAGWEREMSLHPACPPAWAPVAAGLASAPSLRPLAEAAAHLGQPAFTLAPALDHSLRVAFTSGSPQTRDRVSRNELTAEPWGPKFLIPLKAREIQALRGLGADTVYLSAAEYQRSARMLTATERKREIDQRIANGLSPQDYHADIVRLRLTLLAYLQGHREEEASSSRADAANLARLDAAFQEEISALDALLRLVWGPPSGAAYRNRAAALLMQARALSGCADRAGESDIVDVLSLFLKTLPALEPV